MQSRIIDGFLRTAVPKEKLSTIIFWFHGDKNGFLGSWNESRCVYRERLLAFLPERVPAQKNAWEELLNIARIWRTPQNLVMEFIDGWKTMHRIVSTHCPLPEY